MGFLTRCKRLFSFAFLDVYKRQVYKDCWGDVVIGVLGNIQAAHGRARDVQFTVVETDHRQEISYE